MEGSPINLLVGLYHAPCHLSRGHQSSYGVADKRIPGQASGGIRLSALRSNPLTGPSAKHQHFVSESSGNQAQSVVYFSQLTSKEPDEMRSEWKVFTLATVAFLAYLAGMSLVLNYLGVFTNSEEGYYLAAAILALGGTLVFARICQSHFSPT